MEYGSRVPKPGYEAKPSARVMGSRDPYEYWGRWHSFGKPYLNCIIAQDFLNCFGNTIVQILAFYVRGRSWVAAGSAGLWSEAPHTTHFYPLPLLLVHSMTLTAERGLKPQFKKFCWGCHLFFPLTTFYQIKFWSGQCTKVAFTSTAMICFHQTDTI